MRTPIEEIDRVLNMIRPAMHADGGGVDVVSIVDGVVNVRFRGTCIFCPSKSLTLRQGIEKTLKNHLNWVVKVDHV